MTDLANGKRRRFFRVSIEAVVQFRKWLADWHAATSLEEVFEEWEMGHEWSRYVETRAKCSGKRLLVDALHPKAPWDGNKSEPYAVKDELLYLILALVVLPNCDRLRSCPRCGQYFVALRPNQKHCHSECGRREASKRAAEDIAEDKLKKRIAACSAALAKCPDFKGGLDKSVKEYVLKEANRHLEDSYQMGGRRRSVNFITHHAKAIENARATRRQT